MKNINIKFEIKSKEIDEATYCIRSSKYYGLIVDTAWAYKNRNNGDEIKLITSFKAPKGLYNRLTRIQAKDYTKLLDRLKENLDYNKRITRSSVIMNYQMEEVIKVLSKKKV